jgi:hypothetical protein
MLSKPVGRAALPVAPRSKVTARSKNDYRSDSSLVSRRDAMFASVATMTSASLLLPSPSFAGLFNDDDEVKAQYVKTTTDVLAKVNTVLALARDDPAKDAAVAVSRLIGNCMHMMLNIPVEHPCSR